MSVAAAKAIGESFEAINLLQLNGFISDTVAKSAMRRLTIKASKLGVFVSNMSPTGRRLFRQIRVHWGSYRGTQINRYYPSYGKLDES